MTKFLITLISLSAILLSCSKSETNKVQVRIENATGFTLENAQVGDIIYGNVTNHRVTDYKVVNEPIYAGYCIFNVGGVQAGAGFGICGTPLPAPFTPGYYTFTIMPVANGYNPMTVTKK